MNLVEQVLKSKNLSRYKLAEASGIAYALIFRIEKGADVRLSTLEKIAKALQVNIKDLVE